VPRLFLEKLVLAAAIRSSLASPRLERLSRQRNILVMSTMERTPTCSKFSSSHFAAASQPGGSRRVLSQVLCVPKTLSELMT
jgi:hypothetical protein